MLRPIQLSLLLTGLIASSAIWTNTAHAQTWQQLSNFPGPERDDGTSFVINNIAYCGTGLSPWFSALDDFRALDMSSGRWTTVASLPQGEQRQYACGFAWNGKGYVFGGIGSGNFKNDLWQYDPLSDSWAAMKSLPATGRSGAACFVLNGKAYIVGGKTDTLSAIKEVWAYDIGSDSWQQKADLPFGGSWRGSATALNGKGYLLFGLNENGAYQNVLYEYEPTADSWVAISVFPGPGRTHASMEAINGQLVVFGGRDTTALYYNTLWRFNPADTSWAQLPPLPARGRKGGMSFTNGRDLYYSCGIDSANTRLSETWKCSKPVIGLDERPLAELKVYPNPARGHINIELADNLQDEDLKVVIYNIQGKLVLEERLEWPYRLNVESLESGMFVMKVDLTESVVQTIIFLF